MAQFIVSYATAPSESFALVGRNASIRASPCSGFGEKVGISYVETTEDGETEHRFDPVEQFAGDKVTPDRVCVCSSLSVAMQLVATGLGVGIFPTRMIEAYPLKGAVRAVDCHPRLCDGRVFLVDRERSDPVRTAVLLRSVEFLLAELGYFSP